VGVESELRGIGETARESGLSVSALRFYDGAGVLVPALVDPASGYRRYSAAQVDEARLLARLRRAGMPLADVRLVLAGRSGPDTALVRRLLAAHVQRLERGLATARDELSAVLELVERRERPMHPTPAPAALTLPGRELAAALDAVRFAAGRDPGLPMLAGVLFDAEDGLLHLVATDRYRLAVAPVRAVHHEGGRVSVLVPVPLAAAVRGLLADGGGPVRLAVDGDRVVVTAPGGEASGSCPDHGYPDWRRLTAPAAGHRVEVDAARLRRAVAAGPAHPREREQDGVAYEVTVLAPDGAGGLAVAGDDAAGAGRVAVNRAFLLDALAAGDGGRLVVELAGPHAPLRVRVPGPGGPFSLLMPVRPAA